MAIPYSYMVASPPAGRAPAPEGAAFLATEPMPENVLPVAVPQSIPVPAAQAEAKTHDPVDRMLARMDVDHDGRISPREARGLLLELFTWLDRNNDGYLDRNELTAALKRYPGLKSKG